MSMTTDQIALARMYLSDPGTSAVQSIQLDNATGGSFTVTYNGQTTAPVAWNAGANVLQNALCALSNVGLGNLTVQNVSPYDVYFGGALGNAAQVMLTVDTTSLTGTGVTATVLQVMPGGVTAFTDAELDALYDNAQLNFFLAISYAYRVLQGNAAKFNDYTVGQSSEKKAQIFDHLEALAEQYQTWAFAGSQVQFVGLIQVPPRLRAYPRTSGVPATSLSVAPPFNLRNRRNGAGGNGF